MSVRKNEENVKEIAETRETISRAATLIATKYMNMTGESLRSFAKKMGVSQPSMSYLLRWGKQNGSGEKASFWSLDALISLSSLLQISISNLFILMDQVGKTGAVPPTLLLGKYPPRSRERLECIVRQILFYDAKFQEETGLQFESIIDMGDLAWKCPDFVREYSAGTISDDGAYLILRTVDPFLIEHNDPYTRINESYTAFKKGDLKAL